MLKLIWEFYAFIRFWAGRFSNLRSCCWDSKLPTFSRTTAAIGIWRCRMIKVREAWAHRNFFLLNIVFFIFFYIPSERFRHWWLLAGYNTLIVGALRSFQLAFCTIFIQVRWRWVYFAVHFFNISLIVFYFIKIVYAYLKDSKLSYYWPNY
jgi:hypothetical protein